MQSSRIQRIPSSTWRSSSLTGKRKRARAREEGTLSQLPREEESDGCEEEEGSAEGVEKGHLDCRWPRRTAGLPLFDGRGRVRRGAARRDHGNGISLAKSAILRSLANVRTSLTDSYGAGSSLVLFFGRCMRRRIVRTRVEAEMDDDGETAASETRAPVWSANSARRRIYGWQARTSLTLLLNGSLFTRLFAFEPCQKAYTNKSVELRLGVTRSSADRRCDDDDDDINRWTSDQTCAMFPRSATDIPTGIRDQSSKTAATKDCPGHASTIFVQYALPGLQRPSSSGEASMN